MAKLEFLKITNYKSIVDFECRLGKGVNVFTGPSDSGKSNVIRALRDFFFNAKGDEVITAKKTRCSIAINDCIWNKGKGVNQYVTPEGTYENVGRTSPQQLRDHFKIDEIAWDETNTKKLQFIQQHDPKFFLDQSYTGSLNAKILGLVSGIQRTYGGNKLVLNDIKDAKYRRESLENTCKQADEELKKYADLPKKGKLVTAIKNAITELESLESRYDELYGVAEDFKTTKERLTHLERQHLEKIDPSDISRMQEIVSETKRLSLLAKDIQHATSELEQVSSVSVEKIDTAELDRLREISVEITQLKRILTGIDNDKRSYKEEMDEIAVCDKNKEILEAELHEMVEALGVCPLTKDEFCEGCKEKICH